MRNRQFKNSRRGMTLVELLVVAAIIGALLVIGVPMIKPMLESQKTSHAAQVLAGAFQQARMKSIREGQSYGVRLIPYETAPTVAVQLRIQKSGITYFVNPNDVRVRVVNGKIIPYHCSEGKWTEETWASEVDHVKKARDHFLTGYAVQFNRLGRSLMIGSGFALLPPYDNLTLPDESDADVNDAMEYRVFRLATATLAWLPPIVMPRGTVVDLVFSGGETVNFDGDPKTSNDIPAYFSSGNEVIVMFSPAGHVDALFVNGEPKKVNEMLYFCVGDWDRQVNAMGNSLAEDGKSNLEVPATYWVTLHPKTGGVRIAENAPIRSNDALNRLRDARKFAKEHFFNVGEN